MNKCSGFKQLEQEIINKGLCTYCGTCVGICPTQTIQPVNEQIRNTLDSCVNCNLCNKVCPGDEFDFKKFQNTLFSDSDIHYSDAIGSYRQIYRGYSTDENIRRESSSGGVITQILLFLLENNDIDCAIVCDIPESQSTAEVKVFNTQKQLLHASGSKYILSATNAVLHDIVKTRKRCAYVGLPCQIHGLNKAFEEIPQLRSLVVMTIGLFCGFNMSAQGTAFLQRKSGIPISQITEINYRKKVSGSTGFYIKGKHSDFFVPKHGYTFLNLFFSPKRCLLCYDYASEFADISVGDAWEHSNGWSRIIARTDLGNSIVQKMQASHALFLENSSTDDIFHTQKSILKHKKQDFWIRKKVFRIFPRYNIDNLTPRLSMKQKMHGYIMLFILIIGHSHIGHFFLNIMPFHILTRLSAKLRR